MRRKHLKAFILALMTVFLVIAIPVSAQRKLLTVSYPPDNYKTKVDKVFFIGIAPPPGAVTINDKPIERTATGNFAPTLPLQDGENNFTVKYQNEVVKLKVIKEQNIASAQSPGFKEENFENRAKLASLSHSFICSDVVSVSDSPAEPNADKNESQALYGASQYLGCAVARATGNVTSGNPSRGNQQPATIKPVAITVSASSNENGKVLSTANLEVAEVQADDTIARTGPNSNFGRVSPLPKGTKATVIGRQDGDNNGKMAKWVHLDYGAWVNAEDLKITSGVTTAPQANIKNVQSKEHKENTDVFFPLQVPVPIAFEQTEQKLKLTFFNTFSQNAEELVKLRDNSFIDSVTQKSVAPSQVEYTFNYKARQQWGYKYRYDGNTLVLTLRHPPKLTNDFVKPLTGIKILLDPGHGGQDSGAVGANGYTEKEAALFASKLLANELVSKGATVYLTRENDKTVELHDRRAIVERLEPTISVSIHYNSVPEGGDPTKSKGFAVFWYHSQAQKLSNFLHSYVTQMGNRPKHGVIWDNLALARPNAAPSVLLELGFMSNPDEFQWISDPQAQQQMARTIANGIAEWFKNVQ